MVLGLMFKSLIHFLKYILLIMLLQFSQYFPFIPPPPSMLRPSSIPPLSSCPWVVHTSSLSSLFPIPFLSLPVYFMPTNYTSSSLYLFPLISPLPFPIENHPCDVHISDSVPVLVVCLVFVFIVFLSFIFLGSVVNNYEFVVILLFIFLIFLFLDKSL